MNANHLMDPALDCDAVAALIPDYAFGLTSPEETRLVEANLEYCLEAAAQLADYRLIQEGMRAGVPQIEPPEELRERLKAAIAVSHMTPQARRRPLPLAWLAAAAAVIALVISNVYWMVRVDDLARRQNELAALVAGQQDSAFVLTNTNNLRWVRLPPPQEDGIASAFLMWNAESETGLLYAHGFPTLAVDEIYQLWLTRGEERVSGGTFRVDEEGKGALLFHIPQPIDEFTWARVTAEAEDGSEEPTGTVVVVGEL